MSIKNFFFKFTPYFYFTKTLPVKIKVALTTCDKFSFVKDIFPQSTNKADIIKIYGY